MQVDLDNAYEMKMMKLMMVMMMMIIMMMIMMMILMMMIITAVTQSVFKLGPPDFARK